MSDETRLRQDILEVGRRLYEKGFVTSNNGNLSVRLSEDELIITPTGISKRYMSPSDMLKVNMKGTTIRAFKADFGNERCTLRYTGQDLMSGWSSIYPPAESYSFCNCKQRGDGTSLENINTLAEASKEYAFMQPELFQSV